MWNISAQFCEHIFLSVAGIVEVSVYIFYIKITLRKIIKGRRQSWPERFCINVFQGQREKKRQSSAIAEWHPPWRIQGRPTAITKWQPFWRVFARPSSRLSRPAPRLSRPASRLSRSASRPLRPASWSFRPAPRLCCPGVRTTAPTGPSSRHTGRPYVCLIIIFLVKTHKRVQFHLWHVRWAYFCIKTDVSLHNNSTCTNTWRSFTRYTIYYLYYFWNKSNKREIP